MLSQKRMGWLSKNFALQDLSLVQSIILAHDGKIDITSTEEAGTQVTVHIGTAEVKM